MKTSIVRLVGATALSAMEETPTREEALRLYTLGSAWFAHDDDKRGSLAVGRGRPDRIPADDGRRTDRLRGRALHPVRGSAAGPLGRGRAECASLGLAPREVHRMP